MKHCKKCSAGAMRVHILGSGLCQECQSELEWKRGPHIVRQQQIDKIKNNMYKKGEEIIKKKWKEKYGDDDVDAVLGYK
mgnify:FL=1|jgi:hypothetical protein|tara:strand:+ start:377 stop:613 length:237 start_codon:yes stop_codon:yes gene_type:complete